MLPFMVGRKRYRYENILVKLKIAVLLITDFKIYFRVFWKERLYNFTKSIGLFIYKKQPNFDQNEVAL